MFELENEGQGQYGVNRDLRYSTGNDRFDILDFFLQNAIELVTTSAKLSVGWDLRRQTLYINLPGHLPGRYGRTLTRWVRTDTYPMGTDGHLPGGYERTHTQWVRTDTYSVGTDGHLPGGYRRTLTRCSRRRPALRSRRTRQPRRTVALG